MEDDFKTKDGVNIELISDESNITKGIDAILKDIKNNARQLNW